MKYFKLCAKYWRGFQKEKHNHAGSMNRALMVFFKVFIKIQFHKRNCCKTFMFVRDKQKCVVVVTVYI